MEKQDTAIRHEQRSFASGYFELLRIRTILLEIKALEYLVKVCITERADENAAGVGSCLADCSARPAAKPVHTVGSLAPSVDC